MILDLYRCRDPKFNRTSSVKLTDGEKNVLVSGYLFFGFRNQRIKSEPYYLNFVRASVTRLSLKKRNSKRVQKSEMMFCWMTNFCVFVALTSKKTWLPYDIAKRKHPMLVRT